ncbi:MAG: hypothetical protein KDH96_08040, partial [Candidatus Riesia sp.]|nr:hypothetical protein [Candidatus Riesia sp.]
TEVLEYFTDLAERKGLNIKETNIGCCGKAAVYSPCRDKKDSGGKLNYFRQGLKYYNAFNRKYLHKDFIHNSREVRLQLLAGLIDSDGCLVASKTGQYFEFYQTNRVDLIEKVEYLCQTLGYKVSRKTRSTDKGFDNKVLDKHRTKYILRISGNIHEIPTKVARKKAAKRNYLKDFLNTSIKVKKLPVGEYFGFTLKEDNLFLLKDGTVAHNTSNSIQVHNSNTFVVSRNGVQFGVQVDIGTSGNIEAIQETKKKWSNPKDYRILKYHDKESDSQTGFFLPFYMTIKDAKDKNGNTIWEKAFQITRDRRETAARAKDPSVLREEKMNAPIVPSEMWTSMKGYYFPYDEAVANQKRLVHKHLYFDLARPVSLLWDSTMPRGIRVEPNYDLEPYFNFPIESSRQSREAPIVIYEDPILVDGEVPNNAYFFVYDPYVSQNIDEGGSLGCTFVVLDPIYWEDFLTERGPIVASYIGKHPRGLDGYHEVQEKLVAYYGNPDNSLYYEKERGGSCRDYYIKNKKANLLALTPGTYDSSSSQMKRVADYGINVGNKTKKIRMIDDTSDWLNSEHMVKLLNGDVGIKRVIETISCKFTTDQIVDFDLDRGDNYDCISALILIPTAIKEREYYITEQTMAKNRHNPLKFLAANSKLFAR